MWQAYKWVSRFSDPRIRVAMAVQTNGCIFRKNGAELHLSMSISLGFETYSRLLLVELQFPVSLPVMDK
jgi:hypothetical protein